jgi:hypothetical protein
MISCWDFPDAEKLLPGAHAIAGRIAALKARCTRAGVPAIYVNDNRGRWRSDFPKLVELSLAAGGAGAEITSALLPEETDYFVLKPKQSAFFATPLELLLAYLKATRLIVTGVASDQCIWATVNAETGGGKKSGSGRGKAENHAPSRSGGHKGGAAAASRTAAERSASAKKAAATRKRNAERRSG